MIDLKAKPFYLNEEQIAWVEETLAGMSDDRKAEQLFCPMIQFADLGFAAQILKDYQFGAFMLRPNPAAALPGAMAESDYEPLIPALVDPQEYAHSIVNDGEMGFSLDIELKVSDTDYKDPVYDPSVFGKCPSLSSIAYHILPPEDPEYSGLAYAFFSGDQEKYVWLNLVKVNSDVYVGYCKELSESTPDVDFVNTTLDVDEGLLSFSVPEGATALILTNEGEYYDVVKESDDTEKKTAWTKEIWYSENKGIRKYEYYNLHLQMPAIGYPSLVIYSMQEPGKTEYNFKLPAGD